MLKVSILFVLGVLLWILHTNIVLDLAHQHPILASKYWILHTNIPFLLQSICSLCTMLSWDVCL